MGKELTEKQVLKKLKVKSFSDVNEKNLAEFSSMLPYMNPEVAKQALSQFPDFSKMALGIVGEYKDVLVKSLDDVASADEAYYNFCNRILDSLQKELDNQSISDQRKDRIIDKMIEVAKMMDEKGDKLKTHHQKMLSTLGSFGVAIVGIAALFLSGGKINIGKK